MSKFEILSEKVQLENSNGLLSQRELEVLLLIAAGFENSQIAKIFYVTISTIKKQLEKIYQKLQAKNRANAVFRAQILGVITINDYNKVINSERVVEFVRNCKKYNELNMYYN